MSEDRYVVRVRRIVPLLWQWEVRRKYRERNSPEHTYYAGDYLVATGFRWTDTGAIDAGLKSLKDLLHGPTRQSKSDWKVVGDDTDTDTD